MNASLLSRGGLLVVGLIAVWALPGCAIFGGGDDAHAVADPPARIGHVVLITLQDPSKADELIESSRGQLGPIPGITSFGVGRHLETGRDTVDGDYDVALYLGFETEQDYARYLVHPDHVAYVEYWQPRMESIRIFDIQETR